jgi:hypothetical protein
MVHLLAFKILALVITCISGVKSQRISNYTSRRGVFMVEVVDGWTFEYSSKYLSPEPGWTSSAYVSNPGMNCILLYPHLDFPLTKTAEYQVVFRHAESTTARFHLKLEFMTWGRVYAIHVDVEASENAQELNFNCPDEMYPFLPATGQVRLTVAPAPTSIVIFHFGYSFGLTTHQPVTASSYSMTPTGTTPSPTLNVNTDTFFECMGLGNKLNDNKPLTKFDFRKMFECMAHKKY